MKVKRKNRVEIRLSDDELDCLNKAVFKTGLSREAYLRLIGNNINQIAVIAYKTGSIYVLKYKKNFDELQKQIQYVLRVNDEYRKDEVDI